MAKSRLTLATPWTVAHQTPLSLVFPQARILEWVAVSFSFVSSWHQGSNPYILHWQAYSLPLSHQGRPNYLKGCLSESESRSVPSHSLQSHELYSSWNSLGRNTGVDSPYLQGIFPTQGWSPGLLYCMRILYQLSHKGSQKGCLRGKENWEIEKMGRGNSLSELEKNDKAGIILTVFPDVILILRQYKIGVSGLTVSSVTQSCLTLCIPTDCNLPGFPV